MWVSSQESRSNWTFLLQRCLQLHGISFWVEIGKGPHRSKGTPGHVLHKSELSRISMTKDSDLSKTTSVLLQDVEHLFSLWLNLEYVKNVLLLVEDGCGLTAWVVISWSPDIRNYSCTIYFPLLLFNLGTWWHILFVVKLYLRTFISVFWPFLTEIWLQTNSTCKINLYFFTCAGGKKQLNKKMTKMVHLIISIWPIKHRMHKCPYTCIHIHIFKISFTPWSQDLLNLNPECRHWPSTFRACLSRGWCR